MPEPLHPPFGPSATFQPRQLNRWLDVNAQNGPLTRTRGNIILPLMSAPGSFTTSGGITVVNNSGVTAVFKTLDHTKGVIIEQLTVLSGGSSTFVYTANAKYIVGEGTTLTLPFTGWTGTATINNALQWSIVFKAAVCSKLFQFNYSSKNNLSLKLDANFVTVMSAFEGNIGVYVNNVIGPKSGVGNNFCIRYKLTKTGVTPLVAQQYVGQKIIGASFQIEFWQLLGVPTQFGGGLNQILNTSVLGTVDYRFGLDFNQSSQQTVVTNFIETSGNAPWSLPITYDPSTINGINLQ